jgi:hypothetical protein
LFLAEHAEDAGNGNSGFRPGVGCLAGDYNGGFLAEGAEVSRRPLREE